MTKKLKKISGAANGGLQSSFINWLASPSNLMPTLSSAIKTHMDGKSATRLPANLALASSVSLALVMAKRLNAPEQIIAMIEYTEVVANIAINGLDAKSEEDSKRVLKEMLQVVKSIRQNKIIKLPKEHEEKLEKLEHAILAGTVGGVSGGLSSGNISTSQLATSIVLGALDGALSEIDGFEELKSAVKVANRIFKLISDPTKLRLKDFRDLKEAYKLLIARINSDEEKEITHDIESNLALSIEFATNKVELVANNSSVPINSNEVYNLVKAAFAEIASDNAEVQNQSYHENTHNESSEIYDHAKPIASCEKPVNEKVSCIIKISTPIVGEVIKAVLDKLNASGISFKISYCPNAEALNQLIRSGAKFDIKTEARQKLIRKYTPPNIPPDNFDLHALHQLLDKHEQQSASHKAKTRKL